MIIHIKITIINIIPDLSTIGNAETRLSVNILRAVIIGVSGVA